MMMGNSISYIGLAICYIIFKGVHFFTYRNIDKINKGIQCVIKSKLYDLAQALLIPTPCGQRESLVYNEF